MKIVLICLTILLLGHYAKGQKIVVNNTYTYLATNDWYVYKSCDTYDNDSIRCKIDSVLMYTPIKYFLDKNNPEEEDTLSILGYSSVLMEINEPKIYHNKFDYNILRFCWFRDTLPVFYRLEIRDNNIKLNYKITNGKFDLTPSKIVSEKNIDLTKKDYDKLLLILERGSFWDMDTKFNIIPRNVLIESYIDNKYYFINKDVDDIKVNPKNKHILDSFIYLDKLIN